MSRKVTVEIKVKVIVNLDGDKGVDDFIGDEFFVGSESNNIVDTEVIDYEVTDSK